MEFRERHPSYLLSLTAGVAVTASLFSTQPIVAQDASTCYTARHPGQVDSAADGAHPTTG
jgi:hypothetical protein